MCRHSSSSSFLKMLALKCWITAKTEYSQILLKNASIEMLDNCQKEYLFLCHFNKNERDRDSYYSKLCYAISTLQC